MSTRILVSLFIASLLTGCASGGYTPAYIISDSVKEEAPSQDTR